MSGWRFVIATLGLVCSAWPQLLAADDSSPRPAVYAAVLGQVERPGTYELNQGELTELLTAAGGLTPQSSRNVRIIRSGRGLTKVFVGQSVVFPLRDGDVVLAESGSSRGESRLARVPGSAIVAGRSAASNHEIVPRNTFAALGLRPWPVVLSLPVDESSVQSFLRAVNHAPRGKVTVINTLGVPRIEELAEKPVPIAADMVVVLPRGQIDPSMLPPLPEPERIGAAVPPLPPVSDPPERPAPRPVAPEAVVASASPSLTIPAEIPVPPPDPPAEIDLAPNGDTPPQSEKQAAEPTPMDAIPQPHERLEVDARDGWWQRLPTPVVFVAATGLFLAILTALSAVGRTPTGAVASESSAKTPVASLAEAAPVAVASTISRSLIDQLVRNELPLTEERLEYPAGLTLHGQPAEGTQRTDTAHALPEPHFPSEQPPQMESVSAGRRTMRVDRTSEPRRGLLDRALAAVKKDSKTR